MNTEIELYSKMPDPLAAIERLGTIIARSCGYGKIEDGQCVILLSMAERKSPMAIIRTYDFVEGKPRKKALASLAEFRSIGGKHKWLKDGTDGKEAAIELSHDGQTITSRFTLEDAQRQGLVKPRSAWEKTPANMLRSRAISNGVAMLCPEIFAGDDSETETERPALLPTNEKTIEAEVVTTGTAGLDTAKQNPAPSNAPIATVVQEASNPAVENEPRKFTAQDIRINPSNPNLLSDETCLALTRSFGADCTAALDWLKTKKWITDEIAQLSPERARRLIEKPEAFMATVKGVKQ